MERFKNYGLWIALAALVGQALPAFGVHIASVEYQGYVQGILQVLVLAGVINNPSNGKTLG